MYQIFNLYLAESWLYVEYLYSYKNFNSLNIKLQQIAPLYLFLYEK